MSNNVIKSLLLEITLYMNNLSLYTVEALPWISVCFIASVSSPEIYLKKEK